MKYKDHHEMQKAQLLSTVPWQPMETAPKTGSSFDVKCRTPEGYEVVIVDLHYGPPSMGKGPLMLWGNHNFLSPYFTPIAWRHALDGESK